MADPPGPTRRPRSADRRGAARSRPRRRGTGDRRGADRVMRVLRRAPRRPARTLASRRARSRPRPDRATSRSRPPTQRDWPGCRRGTGQHDAPSDRCHDRSIHLVRPCLARHHPRRLARRSLAADRRAHRRRGARRRLQPVRRSPRRSRSHSRAATRAMPTPPRPTDYTLTPRDAVRAPFGRLAPLRGGPRDVARCAQPAAGGRAHDARSGRAARAPRSRRSRWVAEPASGPAVRSAAPARRRRGRHWRPHRHWARRRRPKRPRRPPRYQRPSRMRPAIPRRLRPRRASRGSRAGATQEPDIEGVTNGSSKGQGGAPGRARVDNPSRSPARAGRGRRLAAWSSCRSAFLIAGLGLFVLRWTARRFGD